MPVAAASAALVWILFLVFLAVGLAVVWWVFLRIGLVTWRPFGRPRE